VKCAYNQKQQGKSTKYNLTKDHMERLEEIGVKWKFNETFEQRCHDLETFKSEFGHCNVPSRYSANTSLGQWCSKMRYTFNQIQQRKLTKRNLSQDRIECLEEIGFKWRPK
jgi:hypothetical protein